LASGMRHRAQKGTTPPNQPLDLAIPDAAQSVPWPLCLLSGLAAQWHVQRPDLVPRLVGPEARTWTLMCYASGITASASRGSHAHIRRRRRRYMAWTGVWEQPLPDDRDGSAGTWTWRRMRLRREAVEG